jgi:hypothetical protein
MASVRFHQNSLGAIGCTIGVTPQFGVLGFGMDKTDALHTAAQLAQKLAEIADAHPELKPLLPDATVSALKALAKAVGVVKQGGGTQDIVNTVGPVAASLVTRLLTGGLL